jgi:hypothetical protein
MGFGQPDYGPLAEVRILEMTLFPAEIRTRLMAFVIKKHVAAVDHKLEQTSGRKYRTVYPSTELETALQCLNRQLSISKEMSPNR